MNHADLGNVAGPALIVLAVISLLRRLLIFLLVLLMVAAIVGMYEIITFLHL